MKKFVTKLVIVGWPDSSKYTGIATKNGMTYKFNGVKPKNYSDLYFQEAKAGFLKWIKPFLKKGDFDFDPDLYDYKIIVASTGILSLKVTVTFVDDLSETKEQAVQLIRKTGLVTGYLVSDGVVKISQLAKLSA